jgi:hypothetical protein
MLGADAMERRLQFAAILLVLGLLVEALCLIFGRGAIGFLIFTGLGGLLTTVGMVLYLYSIVSAKADPSKQ